MTVCTKKKTCSTTNFQLVSRNVAEKFGISTSFLKSDESWLIHPGIFASTINLKSLMGKRDGHFWLMCPLRQACSAFSSACRDTDTYCTMCPPQPLPSVQRLTLPEWLRTSLLVLQVTGFNSIPKIARWLGNAKFTRGVGCPCTPTSGCQWKLNNKGSFQSRGFYLGSVTSVTVRGQKEQPGL